MGKAAIIYVVGLSILVSYTLLNMNRSTTDSVDVSVRYYGRSVAHNIALAGANIGTSLLLSNPNYSTTFSDSFGGGWFEVKYDSLNPKGDKRITAIGRMSVYDNYSRTTMVRDTIIAEFRYTPFAKFIYFSDKEVNGYKSPTSNTTSGGNMWKVTGDSMFGYSHTNNKWNLGGKPYFEDKVTGQSAPNTMVYGGVYAPVFNSGYQWGVSITRPTVNLTRLRSVAVAGSQAPGLGFTTNNDVAFTFFNDGRVRVRIPPTGTAIRDTTLPITSITNNGVIAVENGDIRVKGTYKGQVTLAALRSVSGSTLKGNVWIDDHIVANTNPYNNPSSPDMLGLVAQRMTYITTTGISRNSSSVINIQAAIYTQDGVFAAENYKTIPVSGRINLYGALSMDASTSTGAISGTTLTIGFLKSFRHDKRFLTTSPPTYPFSDKYELVSWWER